MGPNAAALADRVAEVSRGYRLFEATNAPDGGADTAARIVATLVALDEPELAASMADAFVRAYPGVVTPEWVASFLSELRVRSVEGPAKVFLASALRRWPDHAWIRFEAAALSDVTGDVQERIKNWRRVLDAVTDDDIPTICGTAESALKALEEHPENVMVSALDPYDPVQYRQWIKANEDHSLSAYDRWSATVGSSGVGPRFSIVMPVFNPDVNFLKQALSSVVAQWYSDWELVMSDDGSENDWYGDPDIGRLVEDSRIRVIFRETNGGIAAATNAAIEESTADWIAFMDQDDLLAPDALAHVATEISDAPRARLFYSDEDSIDELGERFMPYFKPRAVRELLLGQNVINHLSVFRRELVAAVGGLRSEFDGSQDWDLSLRAIERLEDDQIVHVPHILYHWRKTSSTYSASAGTMAKTYGAGLRAVREAVQRLGAQAEIRPVAHGGWFQVALRPAHPAPLASIIIPTRDHPDLLIPCIESVLFSTRHAPFELIIVDNGTRDLEARRFLDLMAQRRDVTVVPWDRPFNFSELLNEGVRHASGEIIVSLNNDVIVYQEDWLDQLVANAQREDVGAVGARLLYADRHVQHAGVLLGVGGVAGHCFGGIGGLDPGYSGHAILNREVEAVTAAVMAVRRSIFLEHGGFDERNLPIAFNDVDFCLRLRRGGLRNLYLASVELTHLESKSRGKDDRPDRREGAAREVAYMMQTWGKDGGNLVDSIKNPNFLQSAGDRLLPIGSVAAP